MSGRTKVVTCPEIDYDNGRSFSPSARAFWHSGQRYSNSEWLSESTSLWIIRAYRKRVALLHLEQMTYVSETAVRRVPSTSSCMADTCLSFLFQWTNEMRCTSSALRGHPITHRYYVLVLRRDAPCGVLVEVQAEFDTIKRAKGAKELKGAPQAPLMAPTARLFHCAGTSGAVLMTRPF